MLLRAPHEIVESSSQVLINTTSGAGVEVASEHNVDVLPWVDLLHEQLHFCDPLHRHFHLGNLHPAPPVVEVDVGGRDDDDTRRLLPRLEHNDQADLVLAVDIRIGLVRKWKLELSQQLELGLFVEDYEAVQAASHHLLHVDRVVTHLPHAVFQEIALFPLLAHDDVRVDIAKLLVDTLLSVSPL